MSENFSEEMNRIDERTRILFRQRQDRFSDAVGYAALFPLQTEYGRTLHHDCAVALLLPRPDLCRVG